MGHDFHTFVKIGEIYFKSFGGVGGGLKKMAYKEQKGGKMVIIDGAFDKTATRTQ